MKKIFIILLSVVAISASAQSLTSLQYSMGFGTGDLGDYIGNASFRGFAIDYRKLVQPNIGVGINLGWNVFYEEAPSETYTQGTASLSGKQYRYNNQFPMLMAGTYYLKPGEQINPFAGLGLGTMYSLRNTDMNLYTLEEDAWHFALCPEVGVMFAANPDMSLSITGKYYYGFEAGDLPSQSYFALNVGFVFTK
jgi:opacity protein-like surface antigen